jgi:rRNA-processing protein FCF1
METIVIILLLIIAAEATYLVASTAKRPMSKKNGRPVFVDTSVLIDGRIISIAKSGFISDTLYIPRSVIGELQYLADNADAEKRSRARHGLDVVSELQAMTTVKVEIFQDGSKAEEGVDERLLKLAKQYSGAVCTIDFNLNKVAQVENIPVLNVNDLAMSLRMAYLPGEKIMLELTQKGNDNHQAIGHLPDGTMVVVEHANKLIGKTVEIEFIRSLQTSAGKMMFAKLVEREIKQQPKILLKRPGTPRLDTRPAPAVASPEAPQVVVSQEQVKDTAPAPTVFHSDSRDQYRRNKPQQKPQNYKTDNRTDQKPVAKKSKPRTSAQNEDDLIRMLNNQ